MRLKKNPKIPEGINASSDNPLKEFLWLLSAVLLVLVIFVATLGFLTQAFAPHIPFRWEQRLTSYFEKTVNPSTTESTALHSVVQDSKEVELNNAFNHAAQAIEQLGAKLVSQLESPADITFQIHLFDEKAPNAFATLGGHIFVTTGLLRQVTSENALSMVLAHEIAHVKYRHPIQALSRGALFQLLIALVAGNQGAGAVQAVLGQTGLLTLLNFNREMERDSDAEAMLIIEKTYGHLRGADEFFRKMADQTQVSEWMEVVSTHPDIETRIKRLADSAEKFEEHERNLEALDQRILDYLLLSSPAGQDQIVD
ncbi:MAG: Zn-dependent protease with chaperone function [Gammaproteobacteria bacterium]|jgi:Zn-dependent protease with chaperone function